MIMMYVFGHTNPDTDAYASAVTYAQYLNDQGYKAEAIALGEPNNETKYVFAQARLPFPRVDTTLPEGSEIFLVDHNEAGQSIPHREQYTIVGVIDHHKVADFQTAAPLYMRVDAVGCACTILYELFLEKGYTPSSQIARLMMSAIISDTLYFRSPTTTDRDRKAIAELAKIAGCTDPETWSLEMFAAKSDLGDMPIERILQLDYKEFDFSGKIVGIGVMETTSPEYALKRKQEILEAMREKKQTEGLDHILFCVVDILQEQNICFVQDESDAQMIREVFATSVQDHQGSLGNILSRKKQVVPLLEKYFSA